MQIYPHLDEEASLLLVDARVGVAKYLYIYNYSCSISKYV